MNNSLLELSEYLPSYVDEDDRNKYYGCIYMTINLVNGKRYIGKQAFSRNIDPNSYYGSGKLLRLAIDKYGLQYFTKLILVYANDREQLARFEKDFIKLYNADTNDGFYNITPGGEGGNGSGLTNPDSLAKWHNTIRSKYGDTYSHLNSGDSVRKRTDKCMENGLGIYSDESLKARSGMYEYNNKIYYGLHNLANALNDNGLSLTYSQVHHLVISNYVSKKVLEQYPDIYRLVRRLR